MTSQVPGCLTLLLSTSYLSQAFLQDAITFGSALARYCCCCTSRYRVTEVPVSGTAKNERDMFT